MPYIVFLAAAFAFLTNYYLVNHRADRVTVTQPQRQTVSSYHLKEFSDPPIRDR
jgi:hypothetical protein